MRIFCIILLSVFISVSSFAEGAKNIMKENMCVLTYKYYQVCHHVAKSADGDRKKCGEAAANLYVTSRKDYNFSAQQAWDLAMFCGNYCRIVNFNDPYPKYSAFKKSYCGIKD